MSAAVPFSPPRTDPPRRRFTRADVERMADAGLFDGLRYELVEGDVIDKMGQKPSHSNALHLLNVILVMRYGHRVRCQSPIDVASTDRPWNEPEPDFAIVATSDTPPEKRFRDRHPRGDETELVIEVADTTLRHDLKTKRDLYARAGVPEYWVLDLTGRRLVVHRQLTDGVYAEIRELDEAASVNGIAVADMLPAPE